MIDDRFLNLSMRYLDGMLDDAAFAEFQGALVADADFRRGFAELCCQTRELAELVRTAGADPVGGRRWGRLAYFAAAAVIVLGFTAAITVLIRFAPHRAASALPPVATVVDTDGAVWAAGESATPGEQLAPGFVHLLSGSATLEFFSGAKVTLRGPAEFGLNSAMRGELRRGLVMADVPHKAHGFTIGAPGMAVVDLGTRFSLDVDANGESRVAVLEGRVRVEHGGEHAELSIGQQARAHDNEWAILPAPGSGAGPSPEEPAIRGAAVYRPDLPMWARGDGLGDEDRIVVVPERRDIRITQPVAVDIKLPGEYRAIPPTPLPAGPAVGESYLLRIPPRRSGELTASLTFRRRVLGVIARPARLAATDGALGPPGVKSWAKNVTPRGLTLNKLNRVNISPDRRTITFTLSTGGAGEVRLLVATDPLNNP